MRFLLDISRTKMPLRFRRRVRIRNSKTREEVSGFANLERRWIAGLDIVIEWGDFDPTKPDPGRAARAARAAP